MGVTERLARATSRHPWRTLAAWGVAILLALALAVVFLPGNLTTNGHVTGNPPSRQAERLFYERFPPDRNGVDELVVVRSSTRTVDDPSFRGFIGKLDAQAAATGVVRRSTVLATSKDRHALLIGIERKRDVDRLLGVIERNDGRDGFEVVMTGGGTLDHDFNGLSQHDLKSGELQVGLPAALIVLVLVFGAVVAGLVPLLMAFVSIVVALGLCALVADGIHALGFRREHAHRDGAGARDRLLALRRLALPGGTRARPGGARRDRPRGGDGEPGRPVQRVGLRHRPERDAARPLERDEEPRGRRDQRRHRVRARRAHAPAGDPRARAATG